ncbi:MAG: hypothetical protein WD737_14615, partial [Gemmatimonadota bacterium]
ALFALAVVSRLVTTVYYIEDADSLRFALSVMDYSVADLRPHFPGYPVFAFAAKVLTAATGSYAVAFSLLGAFATFTIIYYLQRLLRCDPADPAGLVLAALILLNPMVWLLSNRYMPDLLGAACAVAAVYHLLHHKRDLGFFLAGLLAGIRLSFVPLLIPPALFALRTRTIRNLVFGALGVLVWLVPLVIDTGWAELIAAARRQTEGHFGDFGGTVYTEPVLRQRITGAVRGVWAHGLGGYWTMRHPITLLVGAGFAAALAAGVQPLRRAMPRHILGTIAASFVTYLVWISLYQNVIHKSRHVLPLVLFVLLVAAMGTWELTRRGRMGQIVVGLFLTSYAVVTLTVVTQHRQPTAIAQVAEQLREVDAGELYVFSIPLANFYLASVGVEAHFVSTEPGVTPTAPPDGARTFAVGVDPGWTRSASSSQSFYHNPFVNPMWPQIVVREYVREEE